jgi:hypothetical protein
MKPDALADLSIEILIERYRESSAKHGRLLDALETRAANKEHERTHALEVALKSREAQARGRLLVLLEAPEPGTRFWAASAALGFAPVEAASVLDTLARPPLSQVGLSAAMLLQQWRSGQFTPGW